MLCRLLDRTPSERSEATFELSVLAAHSLDEHKGLGAAALRQDARQRQPAHFDRLAFQVHVEAREKSAAPSESRKEESGKHGTSISA
jgi:hypothetical protein